ncbi:V-snare-domain-containing protein [Alternaria alternata]|nr:V-snare-domain-containing protein [Alternaria alternata]
MPEVRGPLLPPLPVKIPYCSKCLLLEVDGRNCVSKRALLNNKWVYSLLRRTWSAFVAALLTRHGRQRRCSTHTRSSVRRQTSPQSPQKKSCASRLGYRRFLSKEMDLSASCHGSSTPNRHTAPRL